MVLICYTFTLKVILLPLRITPESKNPYCLEASGVTTSRASTRLQKPSEKALNSIEKKQWCKLREQECALDFTLDEIQASALGFLLPLDGPPGFQQLCEPFFWNFNLLSNISCRTAAATDGRTQRTGHSCKARWDGACPDTTQRQRYVCKLRKIKRWRKIAGLVWSTTALFTTHNSLAFHSFPCV